MHPERNLIVLTRYPAAGRTKTRLIPGLGAQGAARVHRQMAGGTVLTARVAARRLGARLRVYYSGASRRKMRRWLGRDLEYVPQVEGDLGRRIEAAFRDTLLSPQCQTLLLGTDCPALKPDIIEQGFESLSENDLVLGPVTDGGYYLIGLRRLASCLFHDIPWGTSTVLRDTEKVAREARLQVKLLPALSDVDFPEDLARIPLPWRPSPEAEEQVDGSAPISIVVPTRNEAGVLGGTLESLRGGVGVEILVVDGQSADDTVRVAREHGVRVLSEKPDRAGQLNAGALAAEGKILLFLHADTRLPSGYDRYVREILSRPGVVAGAFCLKIDGQSRSLRIIESFANLRSHWLRLPYGDQGVFLTRRAFRELGGFAELPIMEDFEFLRRLQAKGKILTGPASCLTSARRWTSVGPWKTMLTNQAIICAYHLGVTPRKLARLYDKGRQRGG